MTAAQLCFRTGFHRFAGMDLRIMVDGAGKERFHGLISGRAGYRRVAVNSSLSEASYRTQPVVNGMAGGQMTRRARVAGHASRIRLTVCWSTGLIPTGKQW